MNNLTLADVRGIHTYPPAKTFVRVRRKNPFQSN